MASTRNRLVFPAPEGTSLAETDRAVGQHDLVKDALDAMGYEPGFWRVRMRPGSPASMGTIPRAGARPLHVWGLPGNPVSALVTFMVALAGTLLLASVRAVSRRHWFVAGGCVAGLAGLVLAAVTTWRLLLIGAAPNAIAIVRSVSQSSGRMGW